MVDHFASWIGIDQQLTDVFSRNDDWSQLEGENWALERWGHWVRERPGRNIVFLTFAAALAYRRGLAHIVGGMCETDYSGYPDCRDDAIKALQVALNLGMDSRFVLHTPLMWRDKAATWALAERLGGPALVEAIRTDTHSCYLGDRTTLHDWGYGCGHCPACELRQRGYEEWDEAGREVLGG